MEGGRRRRPLRQPVDFEPVALAAFANSLLNLESKVSAA